MMITVRKARQELYKIDSIEADKLRKDLFELTNQDSTLPAKFQKRYDDIVKKQPQNESMNETLEEAAKRILEGNLYEFKDRRTTKVLQKISNIFDELDHYVIQNGSVLEKVLGSAVSEYKNELKELKDALKKAEQVFLFDIMQMLDAPDFDDED